MIKTKHLFAIFIPAIFIVLLTFFIRVIQYEPASSKLVDNTTKTKEKIQIPIYAEDPVIGDKKAGITIISFEDFGCEGCRSQFSVLGKLVEKHPDNVKIIWKGLPVTKFPQSTKFAHEYGYCLNQQDKFLEFAQLAFSNSTNLSEEILAILAVEVEANQKKLTTCLNSQDVQDYIQKTEQLALVLNVQSIPTVFINNQQINSPQILEGWETLLNL